MQSQDKAGGPAGPKPTAESESSGFSRELEADKRDHVREALDAIYDKEPSCMDEALVRMQQASLCKEAW